MKNGIPTVRIEVPEEYGTAYDGEDGRQWVERRQRIGGKYIRELDGLAQKVTDEEGFKVISKVLSQLFTDWNLEGDEGPLPKPWKSAKAFQALFDSDFNLLMWVASLPFLSMREALEQKN